MSSQTKPARVITLITVLALLSAAVLGKVTTAHAATKLLLWHSWKDADAKLLDNWIADFEKVNADITITAQYVPVDNLRSQFEDTVSGTGPDFVLGAQAWGGEFAGAKLLATLDNKIDKELKAQIPDSIWASALFGGKFIGVPVNTDSLSLYYNNSLADPKNLPQSLNDLLGLSKALTRGDAVGLIMTLDFYPSAGIFFALGGRLLDDKGHSALNTGSAFRDYLTLLKDLYARGQRGELKLNAPNDLFKQGQAAFIVDGIWNLADYERALGDKLGVTLLPRINGTPWSPLFGGTQFFVSASSKSVDAAMAFAKFVTGPDAQAKMVANATGRIPVNPNAKLDDPLMAVFVKQVSLGTPTPNRAEMSAFWTPLSKAINAVGSGGKDVDAVIKDTVDAINTGIDKIQGVSSATATPTPAK